MTDALALALRVGLSLAAVLALMWLAARVLRGHGGGRAAGAVEVLARQPLGRNASVAVVRVADRALVLGVTDGQVSLVADADLSAVQAAVQTAATTSTAPASRAGSTAPTAPARSTDSALAGSVLSPATWRGAVEFVRDRTARRG